MNRNQAKKILEGRRRMELPLDSLKPAAVLIPWYETGDRDAILLTRRADDVKEHKGQVAFPGGHQEPGEPLELTALREAHEEVGIRPENVEIIGALDDIVTITGYRVTPYVGIIPYPYDFIPDQREIADLIPTPVPALLDESNLAKNIISGQSGKIALYYFQYDRFVIWGATSRIVAQFLNVLYGKDL